MNKYVRFFHHSIVHNFDVYTMSISHSFDSISILYSDQGAAGNRAANKNEQKNKITFWALSNVHIGQYIILSFVESISVSFHLNFTYKQSCWFLLFLFFQQRKKYDFFVQFFYFTIHSCSFICSGPTKYFFFIFK